MENEKDAVTIVRTTAIFGNCEIELTAEIPGDDWSKLRNIEVEGTINYKRYSRRILDNSNIQDESDLGELAREVLWKELEDEIQITQDVEYTEYV